MDKNWQEFIADIKAQRELRLPDDGFEQKLDKIKCDLRQGMRIVWYYEEDKAFAEEHGGDPRFDCPFSGIVVALPDVELRAGKELEWEDCAVVVDQYPVEKCYVEAHWMAMGRLIDDDRLVEILECQPRPPCVVMPEF